MTAVIINIFTTYYVSSHYIDSDTSSELILAQHWIETGNILSPDWLYGSELRLFHMQLVYVPLMLLMDDWMTVRFVGALIMQAIYIGSFACLVRAAGKSRSFFFCGGSLLLLPVSVSYGRIVLYHNHYLPNITIAFFLLALTMHFTDGVNWRSKKTWLYLVLLAMLSFAGGMNSIRQLLITHAPLLLTAVILCWMEDAQNKDQSKSAFLKPANLTLLFCGAASAFFSLLGLKIRNVICDKLGILIRIQSEDNTLRLMDADFLNDMLYGFFHQFGFRDQTPMLSVSGILSIGGIFIGCYLVYVSVNRLLPRKTTQTRRGMLLSFFFLAHVTVLTAVFLLTSGTATPYYYPLYFALCYPWAVPLVLVHLEELPAKTHLLRAKKLFPVICVLLLLLTGTVNLLYFQGSNRFPQIYEGLRFQNRDIKAELTEVVTYLAREGYDKGYADHWESNIVTEMTNGDIAMVPIDFSRDFGNEHGNLYYQENLYSLWLRSSPCKKPFLLMTESDEQGLLQSDSLLYCTRVYSAHGHVAYSIDDLDAFVETLYY